MEKQNTSYKVKDSMGGVYTVVASTWLLSGGTVRFLDREGMCVAVFFDPKWVRTIRG